MSFNISRNALSARFVQSAPKRRRNSVFVTILLLLLVFAGPVQGAGDAEFAKQVNDSLGQLRQHAQGDPEAMRVVDNFEKSWKQLQSQLGMLQRSQQQSAALRQTQTKLLAQQKEFRNLLMKLQQQVASSKRPELKTIDPFGDYRAHGVSIRPKDGKLHGPDTGVKEPVGKEVWTDADRLLKGLSILSPSTTTPPAASSQMTGPKGAYDDPLADGAAVKLFDPPQKPFEGPLQKKPPPELPDLPLPDDDRLIEFLVEERGKSLTEIHNERAAHKDEAISMVEFLEWARGKSLSEIQHDADKGAKGIRSAGGPHERRPDEEKGFRYVINPKNPDEVIDMRHFLVVGAQGEFVGLSIENVQAQTERIVELLGGKREGSAFHSQDFFSNALGARFFHPKNYDPNLPLDYQLEKFFFGLIE